MLLTDVQSYSQTGQIIATFLLYAIFVFLHELGHYIGFRIIRLRPKIRLGFVFTVSDKRLPLKTVRENFLVLYLGIFFGYIPIALADLINFPDLFSIILIYVIMCGLDIMQMYNLFKMKKSWDEPATKIYERYIVQLKRELAEARLLVYKDKQRNLADKD